VVTELTTYLPMDEYNEWARNANAFSASMDGARNDVSVTVNTEFAELQAELDSTKRRLAALESQLKAAKK
jgi:hypothetical protein